MDKIVLNYANCMSPVVGDNGITPETLAGLRPRIAAARAAITAQKEKGALGFMELPYNADLIKRIQAAVKERGMKFDTFVVIGIGGSALGNIAVQNALRHPFWNLLSKEKRDGMRIFVPDNVDPDLLRGLADVLDFKTTLFNVISKSGTTAECLANYFVLRKMLEEKVGASWRDHMIFTADVSKGYLREVATREGILAFEVPANVGGRFSVLSAVGLVSAAFSGIDIAALCAGAAAMDERCAGPGLEDNPAALFAATQYLMYGRGRPISVMMPYANALYGVADWYRQLWAESLGKRKNRAGQDIWVGPTPVKALGTTDQHSQVQLYAEGPQDKVITFLSVGDFARQAPIPSYDQHYLGGHSLGELLKAEEEATRVALALAGRPNMTITLPKISPETLGQMLYMLELATAYAGELFDINAFDQPGVEAGKQFTYGLMGRTGFEERRKEIEDFSARAGSGKFTA